MSIKHSSGGGSEEPQKLLSWFTPLAALALSALVIGCTGVLDDTTANDGPGLQNPPRPEDGCITTNPPARVWLLSDRQFQNAVTDLLPAATDVPEVRTPGVTSDLFVYESELFKVEASLATQYQLAAETAATQAATEGSVVPCATEDAACAEEFIDAFAPRAFRRPIDADERAGLMDLFELGAEDGFDRGIALVIEATLQSAPFLYRSEVGDEVGALNSFELAEALSFLFLDSIPDAPLWAAALDGSLTDPAFLEGEVDRLLGLPRVQDNLTRIVTDWVGAERVLAARKDVELFPDYDGPLQESMLEETRLFVHDVLWRRGGDLRELLLSRETFVDARLAAVYGIEGDFGDTHVPATLPAERSGILTQAAILAGVSDPKTTSIVHRGIFIGKLFLCLPEPVPPPPGLLESVEEDTQGLSEIELADYRAADDQCKGCHTVIDPAGIALEAFDPVGVFRDRVDGEAVRTATTVVIRGEAHEVNDARDLATLLANSPEVQNCVADQMVRYAFGRSLGEELACTQDAVHTQFDRSGYNLVEVFRTIALDRAFRERNPAGTEAQQ
ncbi:MAG: DUF1592 domain-containing protein [Myxococcota bacterium]